MNVHLLSAANIAWGVLFLVLLIIRIRQKRMQQHIPAALTVLGFAGTLAAILGGLAAILFAPSHPRDEVRILLHAGPFLGAMVAAGVFLLAECLDLADRGLLD